MDWVLYVFPLVAYVALIPATFVIAWCILGGPRRPGAHRAGNAPPPPDPETSPIAVSPSSTRTLPVYRGVPL